MEFYTKRKTKNPKNKDTLLLRQPLSESAIEEILNNRPQNFTIPKYPKEVRPCPMNCGEMLPVFRKTVENVDSEKQHFRNCRNMNNLDKRMEALNSEAKNSSKAEMPKPKLDHELSSMIKKDTKERIHFQYNVGHFKICSKTTDTRNSSCLYKIHKNQGGKNHDVLLKREI